MEVGSRCHTNVDFPIGNQEQDTDRSEKGKWCSVVSFCFTVNLFGISRARVQ